MSREIKFRAWDKETKSMIKEVWEIGLKSNYNQPWLIGDDKRTDNFELMQYTGLKDKDGKEIYEGDLIKFINLMPIEAKEEIAEVKFVLEDTFLPYIYPFVNISSYNYETKHFEGFGVNSKDCEVIGNIYENSELLKKREKNNDR